MKKQVIALAATTMIGGGLFSTAAAAETYTVQKGDTLWGISQQKGTTVQQLKSVNNLSSNIIYPNQKLEVSGKAVKGVSASKASGAYVVKAGDTLFKIAKKHGTTVQALKSANGLSSDRIYVGDKLALSGSAKAVKGVSASKSNASASKPSTTQAPQGKTLTVEATAYTADCKGCSGITATGINLNNNRNAKVIAVDPNVIPLGSKVYVEGYGTAVAGDTGGAIKGNRIDLHVPTTSEALEFGRRTVQVTVLN